MSDRKLFHLFLDESGLFCETSTDLADQALARRKRDYPSQLAGIVVPDGEHDHEPIKSLVKSAQLHVGMQVGDRVHGTELKRHPAYNELLEEVAAQVTRTNWQAVRMVNEERVSYGDRRENYVNIVAELAVRILEKLGRDKKIRLELRLWPAIVVTSKNSDIPLWEREIQRGEYIPRLQEQMTLLAVRMGWADKAGRWLISFGGTRSGQKDHRLQICDLLSHGSHDNYCVCRPKTLSALKAAFGDCDFTLSIPEVPNRIAGLKQQGFQGLALRELAEQAILADDDDRNAETLEKLRRELLQDLTRTGAPARDNHLATLSSWVDQLIDHARDLVRGKSAAEWLLKQVADPLAETLGDQAASLSWFRYQLHRAVLSASNHLGDLDSARKAMKAMGKRTADLAARWEHGNVLLRGLVVEAVHRTDCYEHEDAIARARLVANFYQDLASLCHDALGDLFPKTVRSQVLGEALGTRLQAEMHAGNLGDATRLAELRDLSDCATEQFDREEDRNRQLQYRCQLETLAGDFPQARHFLARAAGIDDASHESLWKNVPKDGLGRAWFLLHYLRLAGRALLHGSSDEREDAKQVIGRARLDRLDEVAGALRDYPVHGIRRYAAVAAAAAGSVDVALSILGQLRALYPGREFTRRPLLTTILIAAQLEVAGCAWERSEAKTRKLLEFSDPDRPGVLTLLNQLLRQTGNHLPGFSRVFGPWMEELPELLREQGNATKVRRSLLALGARVGY